MEEKNTTTATNQEEAKGIAYYNAFMEDYLATNYGLKNPRSFKINCLNPAHADNNPSMSYDQKRKILHCFSCGASYDLIDLVQLEGHARTCKDAISYLANLYEGKELPAGFNAGAPGTMKDYRSIVESGLAEQTEEDKALLNNFLISRGFTDAKIREAVISTYRLFIKSFEETYYFSEDAGKFNFYENKEDASGHPGYKSEKVALKRVIIPQRNYLEDRLIYNSFNARLIPGTVKATTPGLAEALDSYKKARYRKPSGATFLLFDNMQLLTLGTGAPITIYITEGELDSMSLTASIYEYNLAHPNGRVNAWSIALAGSSTALIINKLKAFTEQQRANFNFIILTDNDSQGNTFKEQIEQGLKELGVFSYSPKLYEALGVKDYNEAYSNSNSDRAELLEAVIKYATNPKSIAEEETRKQKEEERQAYINSKSAYNFLLAFKEDIKTSERLSPTPTGFNNLNNLFKGGIPKGLLTIGALTSLGKTTFILQLADQLAQLGDSDILYFTLEMSKEELISKSISRLTFLEAYRKTKNLEEASKQAKNNLSILQGNRYKYYSEEEKALIEKAFSDYSSFAKRIYFIDSVATGGIDINEIEKIILEHIEKTGRKPIVFLDYLQIIKSPDFHLSDKQATDFNISALKRISAKNSLLIIAISSLNRASYCEKVDLNSFKESGAVEYTNDILIGLNFSKLYEIEEEQATEEGRKRLKEQGLLTTKEEINQNKLKALIKLEKKARPRKITLEVLKNRNGETGGTISFYYYPGANTYLELAPKDADFTKKGDSIFNEASFNADIETPLKLIDSSIDREYQELLGADLPF